VNRKPGTTFRNRLERRIRGASRIAVVGIGDDLSPIDRLGMDAAKILGEQPLPDVRVFSAGTVPESVTGPVRAFRPDHILLLDAADMGTRPGTIAIIRPGEIRAALFSTHALPLSVVMEFLEKDTGAKVTLLGIQPDKDGGDGLSAGDQELYRENVAMLADVLRER